MNKRFNNNPYIKYIIASVVILILIIITGIYLYFTISAQKETVIVIGSHSFEIQGVYGGTYYFKDVSSVELRNGIPEIVDEIKGVSLKDKIKGQFELKGIGDCMLSVNSSKGPYVYVKINGKYLIINFSNEANTRELYKRLVSGWEGMTQ